MKRKIMEMSCRYVIRLELEHKVRQGAEFSLFLMDIWIL